MTFTSNTDKTTGRKCSSDVQFSNFVLSQSTTGRISRTVITTRAQLLKLSYDKYSISTCHNIALSILRGIKDTPVRIRKTRTFVREVCHWLTILNNYNRAACETKGKFPFSKSLIYLLVGYVHLEYNVLYYPENYSAEYEKEVERRVLRMLHVMLDGAEKKFGHKNSEYAVSKCAFRVLNKVNAEYKEEGKLVCTLITKLLKRLKLWDTVTKIQENPMSVLENDSILETLSCDNLDYISDCDSDDSIEYPVSPSRRTFSPFSDKLKQDCPIKLEPPHLDSGQVSSHLSDGEKDGLFYYKSKSTDYINDEADYLDLKKDLHLTNDSVNIDHNRDNFSNRGSDNNANAVAIKSTNEQKSCGDLKLNKRSGNRLISDGEQSCSSSSYFLCDDLSCSLAKNKSSNRNKHREISFNVTHEDPSQNSIPIINLDDEDDDVIIDLIEDDEPSEYVTSSTTSCGKPIFQSADSSSSVPTRGNYHQHAEDTIGRSDASVAEEIPVHASARSFWNMSDSEVASSSTNHDRFPKEYTSHNSIFKRSKTSSQLEDKNEASSILNENSFLEDNFLTEITNDESTEVRFKEIRRIHISSPNNTSAKPDSSQEVLTSNANRSSVIRSRDAAIEEKRYLTHSEQDKDILNSIDEDNTVTSGNQSVDEIPECEQVKSSSTTLKSNNLDLNCKNSLIPSSVDTQNVIAEVPVEIKTMPLRNLQTVPIDEEIDSISRHHDDLKQQEASTTVVENSEEPPNTLPPKSLLTTTDVSSQIVVNEEDNLQQLEQEGANDIQKQNELNFEDENNINIRHSNQEKEEGICFKQDHQLSTVLSESNTKEVNQVISEVTSLSDTRQVLEDTEPKKLHRAPKSEAVAVIKSAIAQQEHPLEKEDIVNEQVQQHIEGVNIQGNQSVDNIESKEKVIISILQSTEKSPAIGKEKLIQTDKLKEVLFQTFGNTDIEISFSSDLQPSLDCTPTEMKKLPDAVVVSPNKEMGSKSGEIFVASVESSEKTLNTSAKEHPITQEKHMAFEEDTESSIDVYNPSLDKEHHLQDELEEHNIKEVLGKGPTYLTKHGSQKGDACSELQSSSDTRQVNEDTSLDVSNQQFTTPSHEDTEPDVTDDTNESTAVVESSQSSLIIENTKSLTTQGVDIILDKDTLTSKDATTNAIVEKDQKLHQQESTNIKDDQNNVTAMDSKRDDCTFLGENQKEEMTTLLLQDSEKSLSTAAIKEEQSLTNDSREVLLQALETDTPSLQAKSLCNAPTSLEREDTTEKIAIELQKILASSGEDDLQTSSKLSGKQGAVLTTSELELELELSDDTFSIDESNVSDLHQDLIPSKDQLESLRSEVPNEHLIQEKQTENSTDYLLHVVESNSMEEPQAEDKNCIASTKLEKDVVNEEAVLDAGATSIAPDQVIQSVAEIEKEQDTSSNTAAEGIATAENVLDSIAGPELFTAIHEDSNEARNLENDVETNQNLPATELEQTPTTGFELPKETDAAPQGLTERVLDVNKGEHLKSVQPDPEIIKTEISNISTEESSFPEKESINPHIEKSIGKDMKNLNTKEDDTLNGDSDHITENGSIEVAKSILKKPIFGHSEGHIVCDIPDCVADTVYEEITLNEENQLIRNPNIVDDANKVETVINSKSNDELVSDAGFAQMRNTIDEKLKDPISDSLHHDDSSIIISEEKDISKEVNEEIRTTKSDDNCPLDIITKEVETDINPKSNDEVVSDNDFEQRRNSTDVKIKDPISESFYRKNSSVIISEEQDISKEINEANGTSKSDDNSPPNPIFNVKTVINPTSNDELVTDAGIEQMSNITDGKIKDPISKSFYHKDSSAIISEEKDISKEVNEEIGTSKSKDNSSPDLISKEVDTVINPTSNDELVADGGFEQMTNITDGEIKDPISESFYHKDSSAIISEEKDISKDVNEEIGTSKSNDNSSPDLISKEVETVINPTSNDELVADGGFEQMSNITDGEIRDPISESFYHEDSSAIISEGKDISKVVHEEFGTAKSDGNSSPDLISKEFLTIINPESNDELVTDAGFEQMSNITYGEIKDSISESVYPEDSGAITSEEKDISKEVHEEFGTTKSDDNSPPDQISKKMVTVINAKSKDELVSDAGSEQMGNSTDGDIKDPISESFCHEDSSAILSEEKNISKEVNEKVETTKSDDNSSPDLICKEVKSVINPDSNDELVNDAGFEHMTNAIDGGSKESFSESFYHENSSAVISEEKDISKKVNEENETSKSDDTVFSDLISKEVHEIQTEGEEACNLNVEQQEISTCASNEISNDGNPKEEHYTDSKDIVVDDGKVILILQSDDATKDENFLYIIDADQLGDDKDLNFVFDEENIEEHPDRKEETDNLETVENNSEIQEVPETNEEDNYAHYFESSDIPTIENEVCVECYEYQNNQQEGDSILATDDKSETDKEHVESNQISVNNEKCSDFIGTSANNAQQQEEVEEATLCMVENEITQTFPMANDISVAKSPNSAQDINEENVPLTLQPHQNNQIHDELPIARVTIESEHFKQSFEVPLESINNSTGNKSIEDELHESIGVSECKSLQPYSVTQVTNNPEYFGVKNKFEISFDGANNLDVKKSYVIQPPEQVAEEKLFFLATVAASQEFLEVAPKDPNQTQTTESSNDDCKDSLKVPFKKALNVGNANSKQVRSRVKMAGRNGSKLEKNVKPNEISENIPNQSAITISTTATESDFNTISEDSCDSFFSGKLVIAEDSKNHESSPAYSGNEYQQSNFDESIYDEDTVEEKLEFVKTTLDDVANTEVQISISDSEEFLAYEGYFPYIDKLRESYNYESEIKFGTVTLKNIEKLKDPVLLKKQPEKTEIPEQNFPADVTEHTQEKDLRKRDGETLSPNEESLTSVFTPTDYSIDAILKSQFVRSIELQEVMRDTSEISKTSTPEEIASKLREEDEACQLDSPKDQVIDDVLTVKKKEDEIKTQEVGSESIQEVNHGTSETPEEIVSKSSKLDKVYQLDSKDQLVNDVPTVEKNQTEKETQAVRSHSIQEGNHVPSEAPAEMVSKSHKRDEIYQLDSSKGQLVNDVPIVEQKENEIQTQEIQTESNQERNLAKNSSAVTVPNAMTSHNSRVSHVNKKIKKNKEIRMIEDVKDTEKLAVDEDLTKQVNNNFNKKFQIDRTTSDSEIFSVTDANNENIIRHRTKAELKAYDRKCKSEKADEIGPNRDISIDTESVKSVRSETVLNSDQKQEVGIYDKMSDLTGTATTLDITGIQVQPKESDTVSMECQQIQNDVKMPTSSNDRREDVLVHNTNIPEGTGGIDKFKLQSYVKLVRLPNYPPKMTPFSISRKSYKSLIDTRTLFGRAKNIGHNLQVRDILRMNKQIARSVLEKEGCNSDTSNKAKFLNSQKTIEKSTAEINNKKNSDGNQNLEEEAREGGMLVDCKMSTLDVNTLEKSSRSIKNVEDKPKDEDTPRQDVSNYQANGSEKLPEKSVSLERVVELLGCKSSDTKSLDVDENKKSNRKGRNVDNKSKSNEEDTTTSKQEIVETPSKQRDNKKTSDGNRNLAEEVSGKSGSPEREVELLDCNMSDTKSLDVNNIKKSNRKGRNAETKSKSKEENTATSNQEIIETPFKQMDNKTSDENQNLAEEVSGKSGSPEREIELLGCKVSDPKSLHIDKNKKSNRKERNVENKSKSKEEDTTISKQENVETPLKQMENGKTSDENQNFAERVPGKSKRLEREVELLGCKVSDRKSLDVDEIKKSNRKGRNVENKSKSKEDTYTSNQEIVETPVKEMDNKKTSDENQNLATEVPGKSVSLEREVELLGCKMSDTKSLDIDQIKKFNRKGRNVENKSKSKEEDTTTSKQEIVETPLEQMDNKKTSGEDQNLAEEVPGKSVSLEREVELLGCKMSETKSLDVDEIKKSNLKGRNVENKSKSKDEDITTRQQDGTNCQEIVKEPLKQIANKKTSDENKNFAKEVPEKNRSQEREVELLDCKISDPKRLAVDKTKKSNRKGRDADNKTKPRGDTNTSKQEIVEKPLKQIDNKKTSDEHQNLAEEVAEKNECDERVEEQVLVDSKKSNANTLKVDKLRKSNTKGKNVKDKSKLKEDTPTKYQKTVDKSLKEVGIKKASDENQNLAEEVAAKNRCEEREEESVPVDSKESHAKSLRVDKKSNAKRKNVKDKSKAENATSKQDGIICQKTVEKSLKEVDNKKTLDGNQYCNEELVLVDCKESNAKTLDVDKKSNRKGRNVADKSSKEDLIIDQKIIEQASKEIDNKNTSPPNIEEVIPGDSGSGKPEVEQELVDCKESDTKTIYGKFKKYNRKRKSVEDDSSKQDVSNDKKTLEQFLKEIDNKNTSNGNQHLTEVPRKNGSEKPEIEQVPVHCIESDTKTLRVGKFKKYNRRLKSVEDQPNKPDVINNLKTVEHSLNEIDNKKTTDRNQNLGEDVPLAKGSEKPEVEQVLVDSKESDAKSLHVGRFKKYNRKSKNVEDILSKKDDINYNKSVEMSLKEIKKKTSDGNQQLEEDVPGKNRNEERGEKQVLVDRQISDKLKQFNGKRKNVDKSKLKEAICKQSVKSPKLKRGTNGKIVRASSVNTRNLDSPKKYGSDENLQETNEQNIKSRTKKLDGSNKTSAYATRSSPTERKSDNSDVLEKNVRVTRASSVEAKRNNRNNEDHKPKGKVEEFNEEINNSQDLNLVNQHAMNKKVEKVPISKNLIVTLTETRKNNLKEKKPNKEDKPIRKTEKVSDECIKTQSKDLVDQHPLSTKVKEPYRRTRSSSLVDNQIDNSDIVDRNVKVTKTPSQNKKSNDQDRRNNEINTEITTDSADNLRLEGRNINKANETSRIVLSEKVQLQKNISKAINVHNELNHGKAGFCASIGLKKTEKADAFADSSINAKQMKLNTHKSVRSPTKSKVKILNNEKVAVNTNQSKEIIPDVPAKAEIDAKTTRNSDKNKEQSEDAVEQRTIVKEESTSGKSHDLKTGEPNIDINIESTINETSLNIEREIILGIGINLEKLQKRNIPISKSKGKVENLSSSQKTSKKPSNINKSLPDKSKHCTTSPIPVENLEEKRDDAIKKEDYKVVEKEICKINENLEELEVAGLLVTKTDEEAIKSAQTTEGTAAVMKNDKLIVKDFLEANVGVEEHLTVVMPVRSNDKQNEQDAVINDKDIATEKELNVVNQNVEILNEDLKTTSEKPDEIGAKQEFEEVQLSEVNKNKLKEVSAKKELCSRKRTIDEIKEPRASEKQDEERINQLVSVEEMSDKDGEVIEAKRQKISRKNTTDDNALETKAENVAEGKELKDQEPTTVIETVADNKTASTSDVNKNQTDPGQCLVQKEDTRDTPNEENLKTIALTETDQKSSAQQEERKNYLGKTAILKREVFVCLERLKLVDDKILEVMSKKAQNDEILQNETKPNSNVTEPKVEERTDEMFIIHKNTPEIDESNTEVLEDNKKLSSEMDLQIEEKSNKEISKSSRNDLKLTNQEEILIPKLDNNVLEIVIDKNKPPIEEAKADSNILSSNLKKETKLTEESTSKETSAESMKDKLLTTEMKQASNKSSTDVAARNITDDETEISHDNGKLSLDKIEYKSKCEVPTEILAENKEDNVPLIIDEVLKKYKTEALLTSKTKSIIKKGSTSLDGVSGKSGEVRTYPPKKRVTFNIKDDVINEGGVKNSKSKAGDRNESIIRNDLVCLYSTDAIDFKPALQNANLKNKIVRGEANLVRKNSEMEANEVIDLKDENVVPDEKSHVNTKDIEATLHTVTKKKRKSQDESESPESKKPKEQDFPKIEIEKLKLSVKHKLDMNSREEAVMSPTKRNGKRKDIDTIINHLRNRDHQTDLVKQDLEEKLEITIIDVIDEQKSNTAMEDIKSAIKDFENRKGNSTDPRESSEDGVKTDETAIDETFSVEEKKSNDAELPKEVCTDVTIAVADISKTIAIEEDTNKNPIVADLIPVTNSENISTNVVSKEKGMHFLKEERKLVNRKSKEQSVNSIGNSITDTVDDLKIVEESSISDDISARMTKTFQDDTSPISTTLDNVSKENPTYFSNENKEDEKSSGKSEVVATEINIEEIPSNICSQPLPTPVSIQSIDKPVYHETMDIQVSQISENNTTSSASTTLNIIKDNLPSLDVEIEKIADKSEVIDISSTVDQVSTEEIPSSSFDQTFITPSTHTVDKPANHEKTVEESFVSGHSSTMIEKIAEKSEVIDISSTVEQVRTEEIPSSRFDQTFVTPSTHTVDKPANHETTVEESFVGGHSSTMIDVQVPEASENDTTTLVSATSNLPSLSLNTKEVSDTSKIIDVSSTTKQINTEETPMSIDDDEIPTCTPVKTVDRGDNSNKPVVSRTADFKDQQHSHVSSSATGGADEETPINAAPPQVVDSKDTILDKSVSAPAEISNKKSIVEIKSVPIKLNENTSTNTKPKKTEVDVSYGTASTSRDVSDKNNLLNNFDLSSGQSKNLDAFTPPISVDTDITEVVISAAAKLSNLISWPGDTVPDTFLSNSDSEHTSIQTEAAMQEDIFDNSNLEYFPERITETAKENVPQKVDSKPAPLQNVERKTQVLAPIPVVPVKEHTVVDNSLKTSVPTTMAYGGSNLSAITNQMSSYVGDRILSIGENDLPVTSETPTAAPGKIFDPIDEDTLLTDKLKERGSMRFGGTSDHDYSAGLGGPFLVSTEDNDNILSFSEESVCMSSLMSNNLTQEQDERGSTEDLSNSPVDNTIFPSVCIGTFMDHDLTQEAGRSLNHSPVDGANNYQFNTTLTEDINSLIDLREESLSVAQMNDLMMDNHHGSILHHLGMDDHHGTNLALSNIAKISEENRKYLSEFDLVDQENIISRIVSGENVKFPHHQISKEIGESVAATSELKPDVAMLKVEVKYNEHAYQSSDRIKNVICPELSKNDMFKVSSKTEAKQKEKTEEIIESKPFMKLPCPEQPRVPSTLRKNDMFKVTSKTDEKQKQKTAQSVEKKPLTKLPCEEQGSSPKASSALRAQVMLDMQKRKYETKPKDTHLGYPIRQNSRTPVCAPVKKDSPVHNKRSPEQITSHSSTSPPGTPLKLLMTQAEGNLNTSTSSPIHTKDVVVEKSATQVADAKEVRKVLEKPKEDIEEIAKDKLKELLGVAVAKEERKVLEKPKEDIEEIAKDKLKELLGVAVTKEVRKVLEKPKEDIEEIAKDKLKELLGNIVIGKARSETPKINHAQLANSVNAQQSTPVRQENTSHIDLNQSRSTPNRQQSQSNTSKSETPKVDSSRKSSPATPSRSKQDMFDARKHNDFYVDKYDAIKSKRRQCTERLIDNLTPEKLLKIEEDAKNRSKLDERSKRGKSSRTPKHRQLVDYDDSSLSDEQAVNKYDKDQRRNERERLIFTKRGADSPGDLEPLSKRKKPLTEEEAGSIDEQKRRMLNKRSGGDSSDDELLPGGELKKPLTQEELNAAFDKLIKEGSDAKDDTKPSDNKNKILNFDNKNASPRTSTTNVKRTPSVQDSRRDKSFEVRAYHARPNPNQLTPSPSGRQQSIPPRKEKPPNGRSYQGRSSTSQQQSNTPAIILNQHQQRNMYEYYSNQRHNPRSRYSCLPENTTTRKPTDRSRSQATVPYQYLSNVRVGNPRTSQDLTWMKYVSPFLPKPPVTFGTEKEEHQ